MRPKYWELVDALVGMACQYLEDSNGELDDDAVSAGEIAVETLTQLGLVENNKLVKDAFNHQWIQERFGETPNV